MGEEQDRLLNIVEGIIEAEHNFLNTQALRLLPHADRSLLIRNFLALNSAICEISLRNSHQPAITTYTVSTRFFDAVPVIPTQNQIEDSIVDVPNPTGNCAICQEQVSSAAVKISHCGHVFHRTCILQWFETSVRCPVCRYDIRTRDPLTQTNSA